MSTATEQKEARSHHTTSPSTLTNREACPCFESRTEAHVRAIAGTLAHAVVETGQDNDELSDEDAAAAAECMDFVADRRNRMDIARQTRLNQTTQDRAKDSAYSGWARSEIYADALQDNPTIEEIREIYLPIDDCFFPEDKTESTTAGYVDHVILDLGSRYAEMVDYKFGVWPVEDAELNLQGIAYVLGLFKKFPKLDSIRFFFKQPLIESLSEAVFHRTQIPELYLRVQTVVMRTRQARELKAKNDWSMATPKIPACNFCSELGRCPKVAEFALKVGNKFHAVEVPDNITPTELHDKNNATFCMRLAQLVSVWASSFKQTLTNRVLEGRSEVPTGFKLSTASRRELVDKAAFKKVALEYLTEFEFNNSLDVLFGAVEKAIMEKAPRGTKGATVDEFKEKLYEAGATVDGLPYAFLKATAGKKKEKQEQTNK